MRILLVALFLIAAPLAAPTAIADGTCPDETARQEMGGLAFCIPQSNERYRFTPKGVGPMYWLGEEPIEPPASDPGQDEDITIVRVWADRSMVGMSDQASGAKGFDRFLDVIATSILKAANQSESADEFMADVPMDQSGRVQPFRFERLASGVLKGVRQDPDQAASYMLLMRPPVNDGQPHLMMCGIAGSGVTPAHLCMSFIALLDQRMAITIAGRNLDRSFRLSEEVERDLDSFVMQPAGAP